MMLSPLAYSGGYDGMSLRGFRVDDYKSIESKSFLSDLGRFFSIVNKQAWIETAKMISSRMIDEI